MGSGPPVGRHSEAAKNVFYGVEGRSYVATRISFSMLLLPRSVFFFPKRRLCCPIATKPRMEEYFWNVRP